MTKHETIKRQQAVIYGRVSSVAQMKKGHGLESQKTTCRDYARLHDYEVIATFEDKAMSGKLLNRPEIKNMLRFVKKRSRDGEIVIIIDHISRLARDLKTHFELHEAIIKAGGRLESPTMEFGRDPNAKLIENLMASIMQHQREQNGEQTERRMRARLSNGYWPFINCIGYRFELVPGRGKMLKRDEPYASIIQEALEGYASGRFQTQAEVKRFFESQPDFPKNKKGEVRNQRVNDILTKPIYAGYVGKAEWDIPLHKGQHEGLIDFQTFQRIQDRLLGGAKTAARPDIRADFALRGTVSCGCCGKLMTSCWSTSKTGKKHAYYFCFSKGCPEYRKSIRRDVIEEQFEELLAQLSPEPSLVNLTRAMLKSIWEQRLAQAHEIKKQLVTQVKRLDVQIENFMDRIVETDSKPLIAKYEGRVNALHNQKLVLEEKAQKAGKPQGTFEEIFELSLQFLKNPAILWSSGQLGVRKLVLRLTFADKLEFCRNEGFRTPKTTLPFKVLGGISLSEKGMAGMAGLNFAGLCFLRLDKIADRAVPDRGLLGLFCGGEQLIDRAVCPKPTV